MQFIQNQNWVTLSIIALFGMIPVTLMYSFLGKNFGIPVPMSFMWYAITFMAWVLVFSFSSINFTPASFFLPIQAHAIITVVTGCSAIATLSLFTASTTAPNSALPFLFFSGSSVASYFVAGGIAKWLPDIYLPAKVDAPNIFAIILIISGFTIIMWRK